MKLHPLPEKRASLGFAATFSTSETAALRRGFMPQQMEDKWLIAFEDDSLLFYRSWTGFCIYRLRLKSVGEGSTVTESWVNRDPQQYSETDTAYDRELLRFLIDAFLLGRQVAFPKRVEVSEAPPGLYQHAVVGRVSREGSGTSSALADPLVPEPSQAQVDGFALVSRRPTWTVAHMNHRFALLLAGGLLALGMQSTFALEVALVGDSSKLSALKRIAQEMKVSPARAGGLLRVTSVDKTTTYSVSDSSDDVVAIANQLLTSDVAFLIVDSTTGPLPVVREHLIVSRQARVPRVVIYFTSTAALQAASPKDAAELLELQEMEMRELLGKYGMDGEQAAVLFDGDVGRIYKSKFSRGQSDVSRFLTSYSLRRPPQPVLRPVSEFTCAYYLLSNPETNGKGVTLADRDAIDVWADGKAVAGAVRSSTSHKPGDVGELVLRLSAPLNTAAGSRVLLVRNGSAVGIGVVKAIAK